MEGTQRGEAQKGRIDGCDTELNLFHGEYRFYRWQGGVRWQPLHPVWDREGPWGLLSLNGEENSNCKGARANSRMVERWVVTGIGGEDSPKGLHAEPHWCTAGYAHQFTVAAHMLRVCFKSGKPTKGRCLIVNCFSNCADPFHGVQQCWTKLTPPV